MDGRTRFNLFRSCGGMHLRNCNNARLCTKKMGADNKLEEMTMLQRFGSTAPKCEQKENMEVSWQNNKVRNRCLRGAQQGYDSK